MRVLLGSLLAILALGSATFVSSQDPSGVKLSPVEQEILELTNAARKEHNAPPLSPNPILMTLARDHSENQAKQNKMSHVLDGKSPVDRVKASPYKYKTTGENVAYNRKVSGKDVFDMWMKSDGHRKNILNPAYLEIGIGMGAGNGSFFYTQVFGRSAGPIAANAPIPAPPKLTPPKTTPPKTNEIPQLALQSAGWVTVSKNPDERTTGYGVLVDQDLRLFVTTYHLVEGVPTINTYFPSTGADGKIISEPKHYLEKETPIVGELVIRSSKRDLAVFRLKSLRPGVPALKLADKGVNAGDRISAIGKAPWTSAEGSVRQTIFKKFRLSDQQSVAAWMIETTLPVDKSAVGGPVVNERGEIVGITCSPDPNEPLVSNCIEVREIQAILELARGELTQTK